MGDTYESTSWYRNVPIQVGERTFYANLVVIKIEDYDVILGMDWLSAHHTVIDYRKRRVQFQPPDGEEFNFKGTSRKKLVPIILALQALKLLASGCCGYIANILD